MPLRRNFSAPFFAPPVLTREEAKRLRQWVENRQPASLKFLGGKQGFGITHLLEEVKEEMDQDSVASTTGERPWIFCPLDLSKYGNSQIIPLLVSARNTVLKRIDMVGRQGLVELNFLLFDLAAAMAWKRRFPKEELPTPFFRTQRRARVGSAFRIAKAFALGELVDATSDLLGLRDVIDKVLDTVAEEALDKAITRIAQGASHGAGAQVLSEAKKGNKLNLEHLESLLPVLFADALNQCHSDLAQARKYPHIPSFVIAIDAADFCAEETSEERELRERLSIVVKTITSHGSAKVIIAGRNGEAQLFVWREALNINDFVETHLRPFTRSHACECIIAQKGWPSGIANLVLNAVCGESEADALHPTAYGRAVELWDKIPSSPAPAAIRRTVIALVKQQPFTELEFQAMLSRETDAVSRPISENVWDHPLWTISSGNMRRRTVWYIADTPTLLEEVA